MRRFFATGCALLAAAQLNAAEPADTQAVVTEVMGKYAKATGIEANLELRYKRGAEESVATSTLAVSRQYGWKLEDFTPGAERRIVNDFRVSYQYFPRERRALKMTADLPEIEAGFRKPAEDLNPLLILDQASLKFLGEEPFEGEAVYHFSGTTETQLLEMGKPARREMEVWVGKADGMPRKTVERTEEDTVTTIYRDVKLNPDFKREDFQFTPPTGVEVVDLNRLMQQGTEEAEPTTGTQPPQ